MDNSKEKYIDSLPIPVSFEGTQKIIEQMNSGICLISNDNRKGIGFFVEIPYKFNLLHALITSNQVINKDDLLNVKNISIYINNDNKTKTLKLDRNRKIYTNEKLNITIIEIKGNENINDKYLELDDEIINYLNLNKKKNLNHFNNIYSNESIYILNYLKEQDITVSYGKLSHINNSELYYQCNIKEDSSGSPILLTNNQKLIGIHNKNSKKYTKGNLLAYSIYEFLKIKNNLLLIDKYGEYSTNNYIIAEFDIQKDNQDIRIINSYEKTTSGDKYINYKKEYENENEIKDNCQIRINDELIPFSYFYTFKKKGKYKIKYSFLLNITKSNYLFNDCSSLINIDLSNFNTNNINNMCYMFNDCSFLLNINLSNFNTNKVTDMSFMFNECSSLLNINLSNFNTNNVTNMCCMFSGCSSLTSLDLSNFNTNNVTNMSCMFYECSSLLNINLSNFNTNNFTDISKMFYGCYKLNKNKIITKDKNILNHYD